MNDPIEISPAEVSEDVATRERNGWPRRCNQTGAFVRRYTAIRRLTFCARGDENADSAGQN